MCAQSDKILRFLPALASLPTVRKFVKIRPNETDKVNFTKVKTTKVKTIGDKF